MFQLRSLFQQHRDVSLKLARHVFFSDFEGHQSLAKGSTRKQTDAFLTLANPVLPTAVHKGESNMVFSPLLMQVVLGLMTAGSAGPSRDELLSFLKSNSTDEINYLSSQLVDCVLLDASPNGGLRLSAANSVWVDQSARLKPSFTQIVDNVYKATSLSVDFASKPLEVVNQVNQWAEKETAGLINEILPVDAVDHLTRLVFANSLYFKGVWSEKFNASMTKNSEFHLLNGTSVQVPFMTCQSKRYVKAYEGFKMLRLPYKRGLDRRHFSMYFFLPDANDGLPGLVEKVTSDSEFLERHLPYAKVGVPEFRIPKFKISFGFEASEILKGLGVVSPFSGHALTEMVETICNKGLFVDSIFHKSVIEIDEEGTKGAAAITDEIGLRSHSGEKVDFIADHPFLFLIREDGTGVVLFAGSILNPLLE